MLQIRVDPELRAVRDLWSPVPVASVGRPVGFDGDDRDEPVPECGDEAVPAGDVAPGRVLVLWVAT